MPSSYPGEYGKENFKALHPEAIFLHRSRWAIPIAVNDAAKVFILIRRAESKEAWGHTLDEPVQAIALYWHFLFGKEGTRKTALARYAAFSTGMKNVWGLA